MNWEEQGLINKYGNPTSNSLNNPRNHRQSVVVVIISNFFNFTTNDNMKKYTLLSFFGFLAVIVFLPFSSLAITYTSGSSVYYPSSGTSGGGSVNYCVPPNGFGYTTTAQCDGLRQQALTNGSAQYTPEISQGVFQSCMNQVSAYQTAVRQYNNCLSQPTPTSYSTYNSVSAYPVTLDELEQQKIDATNTYVSQKLEILKQQQAIDAEKYNIERQAQQDYNNSHPTALPPKVTTDKKIIQTKDNSGSEQIVPPKDNVPVITPIPTSGNKNQSVKKNIFNKIVDWFHWFF